MRESLSAKHRIGIVVTTLWVYALRVGALPSTLIAQDRDPLTELRSIAACLHAEDVQIQRALDLISAAERRANAADVSADIRHDAHAAIDTLRERVREHIELARACAANVPRPGTAALPPAPPHPSDSLAEDRGTVHEIERDEPLLPGIRIVVGERVDGPGAAPDESVRRAVRRVGPGLRACYESYRARQTARLGDVHVSFAVGEGGRIVRARVESAARIDTAMRVCIEREVNAIRVDDQRGSSEYAYTLAFGGT